MVASAAIPRRRGLQKFLQQIFGRFVGIFEFHIDLTRSKFYLLITVYLCLSPSWDTDQQQFSSVPCPVFFCFRVALPADVDLLQVLGAIMLLGRPLLLFTSRLQESAYFVYMFRSVCPIYVYIHIFFSWFPVPLEINWLFLRDRSTFRMF